MTIRLKIFVLAAILLAILSAAVLISTILQAEATEEIGGITDYHIPITAMVSEVDVLTFEYELEVLRVVHHRPGDAVAVEKTVARARQIAQRMREHFEQADVLLGRAVEDERNDVSDRLVLSRTQATLGFLARRLDPFVALGESLLAEVQSGATGDSNRDVAEFLDFDESFGMDLAKVREDLNALTEASAIETHQHQTRLFWVSAILLAIAGALGLGLSAMVANQLVRGLRDLLTATEAVQAGDLSVKLAVEGTDEVASLTAAFNSMTDQLRAVGHIKETFGKYIDPRIVEKLIDPESEEKDVAERRVVTVFFSDIAGFTAIGEQLTAARLAKLLNSYFTEVTAAIDQHHGIIDKYIGDAIMAFWTPPFSQGDSHAAEACLAALAQRDRLVEFRRELPEILGLRQEVPEFRVRMALATGEVLLGTLGSPTAKSYTVIGDVVNVASRLEGTNKIYKTEIIASEETVKLARDSVETRELDRVVVVGKNEPVRIFEVMAVQGQLDDSGTKLKNRFERALADYRQQSWTEAAAGFKECLELNPEDGPSQVFIERVARLQARPPSADWDGVWRLKQK